MMNHYSMTQFAASVAEAFGTEAPKNAGPAIPAVGAMAKDAFGGPADRLLIYNPDCLGLWFWQKYTDRYLPVMVNTRLTVPIATVMPAVTPVCFGTMYTGAMPAVHGIESYCKPVIKLDSLFDSMARSGKKVALVAVKDSSMAKIFLNRAIDYMIEPDDAACVERGLELVKQDRHDAVIVYNQDYDDCIHDYTPEDPKALDAAWRHIRDFGRLADAVREDWKQHDTLLVWAPDHGNHLDWDGHGNHGEFREEDINTVHFFGAFPKQK